MKKSLVVVLLVLVAAASSAATLGVQKIMKMSLSGGDIIIISDKRCKECDASRVEGFLKKSFPNTKIAILDYSEGKARKIYDKEKLDKVPVVLLPKALEKDPAFEPMKRMAKPGEGYYIIASIARFDPKAEICDNSVDDDNNKLIDCQDPGCKGNSNCMEKREKPDVDVFVMSHCPFGTQIEKGLLPVWDLFGDKINLNIRFVDYAMHGKKELDEELKQYCVAQQGKPKLRKYLECFLKSGEEGDKCVKETGVDSAALSACITKTDKEFSVTAGFEDKSKWSGGRFPPFPIDAELSKKYKVQGSPTLVINEVTVQSGRNPKALRDAICKGFKEPPAECTAKIDESEPSPGFGTGKAQAPAGGPASGAACGG